MGGFIFILFAGVMIIVIVVGISQSKQATEAWSSAARSLGLTLDPGGAFRRRNLSGIHRDNHVQVDTFSRGSGKSSTTYTRYRIRYPKPLGLGLQLTQEGFFTGVSKAFGAQDIEVGDAGFDQSVLIKGNNPQAITRFLTLARRSRIHRALYSFNRLKIGDDEIYWEHRGVQRSAEKLSGTIQRLSQLAWFLWADREEDQALERATKARQEGRLDDAMQAVREVPTVDNVPPIEARVMEAHMLHLANRGEEAGVLLDEVVKQAPDDQEVRQWATMQQQAPTPPSLPGSELPPPPPAPEPAPVEPSGLSAEDLCNDLFKDGPSSADIEKAFAAAYAGKRVSWHGTLRSQQSTSFDFVFGNKPCTKATLELLEIEGGSFGRNTVQAIVQFPPEAKDTLQDLTGKDLSFSGTLLKVDGLMRNLFVAEAVLS